MLSSPFEGALLKNALSSDIHLKKTRIVEKLALGYLQIEKKKKKSTKKKKGSYLQI